MGVAAARKARACAENLTDILVIELLCAAQALEFQRPLRAGRGTAAAYDLIRRVVPSRDDDRDMYPDLEAVRALIDDGSLETAVESALRP
jgi:histidine ammonia-lyase